MQAIQGLLTYGQWELLVDTLEDALFEVETQMEQQIVATTAEQQACKNQLDAVILEVRTFMQRCDW